jgi:tetratricopeptide (TPR) repeat protein
VIEPLLKAENALALGLLDQAERTFRQVLDVDPHNGIAAIGLSRVALERGDDATALVLAQAALAIDPENATARRMIDRLEEVARYRTDAIAARSAANAAGPKAAARSAADPPGPEAAASSAADAAGAAADAAGATGAADAAGAAATILAVPATTTAAPSVTMPTSAPSVPVPERPGFLRRLLRRS